MTIETSIAVIIALTGTTVIVFLRYFAVSWTFAALTDLKRPGYLTKLTAQIRREKLWSTWSAPIYGVPAGFVLWLWQQGHPAINIYYTTEYYPAYWMPLAIFVYLFAHDTWFYWTHRWMHRPTVYRRMHYVHHQSHPPTAWAAMSFHPWEALSGAILIPALTLIIPIHVAALAVVMAIATLFGTTNHLGWELFPQRWINGLFGKVMITASHHERHHRRNRCNYGLYFRFWDWLCGTDAGLQNFSPSEKEETQVLK